MTMIPKFTAVLLLLALSLSSAAYAQKEVSENHDTFQVVRPYEEILKELSTAIASSMCSAKNETGGRCSISCPAGQRAECHDAVGGGAPTCECR